MTLTLTDLFCGAGGSAFGAELVDGVRTVIAANHWDKAIRTHEHNLPHAAHDCADISQIDPRRYPATDLLWASPECTNHSQAKGVREADRIPDLFGEVLPDDAAERSRATMWDVVRFIEAKWLAGRPYAGFVVEFSWRLCVRNASELLLYVAYMSATGIGVGPGRTFEWFSRPLCSSVAWGAAWCGWRGCSGWRPACEDAASTGALAASSIDQYRPLPLRMRDKAGSAPSSKIKCSWG